MLRFPKDFVWGSSTSGPQTEGRVAGHGFFHKAVEKSTLKVWIFIVRSLRLLRLKEFVC